MLKLLTTLLFVLAMPMVSHAQEWRTYDDQNYMRLEINAQAVRSIYPGTSQDQQANAARAIANGAPIPAPARYSEEDAKRLWEEAAFTSNGMSYQWLLPAHCYHLDSTMRIFHEG